MCPTAPAPPRMALPFDAFAQHTPGLWCVALLLAQRRQRATGLTTTRYILRGLGVAALRAASPTPRVTGQTARAEGKHTSMRGEACVPARRPSPMGGGPVAEAQVPGVLGEQAAAKLHITPVTGCGSPARRHAE
jgi:hypothetical protein